MVTPIRYEHPHREPSPARDQVAIAQPGLGAFWAILVRNRLLIALCAIAVTAAAAYYTEQQTPTYQASASLRVWTREPNLPEIYRSASSLSNDMATEIAMLNSRALKEDAAVALGLPLQILEPEGMARDELMTAVKVAADAPDAEYVLVRRPDKRFDVLVPDSFPAITISAPDGSVQVPGASFVLTPAAVNQPQIRFQVTSMGSAVGRLSALSVGQLSRDASIISLGYRDTDPVMASRVPNVIATRYMVRRQALEKGEAGSAARFLRDQLTRVSSDLRDAEDEFRRFKERERVLDPSIETGGEVSRLINKEAERSNLEEERQALRASLADIERGTARSGEQSPYRKLVGLPFLLRNGAASALLNALVSAENERAALVGSTSQDPDVQALTARIRNIEEQLGTITHTYLRGLDNQAASLDASLGAYSERLGAIPRKQLEFARLDRQVKNLESVYNLLETRLNEAEIVEAVENVSVAVVDSAVVPTGPSSPNVGVNLAAGLAAGLMLGVALACVRDVRDRSVHSRRDVMVATGIPVIGLIPRIPRGKGRVALITGHGRLKAGGAAPPRRNGRVREPASYTFLGGEPVTDDSQPESVSSPPVRVIADHGLVVAQWTNALAEAYSLLLTNIMFARPEPVKVIVITSPLAEDGKTTCAVNLAITLALRGAKVLLVDADLRRGVVHRALGTDQQVGLSEVLAGSALPGEVVRAIPVGAHGGRLHFVTTGRVPPNPSVLLESTQYQGFIQHVRADFDTVIVDAPPVNIISDASILGLSGDAVVMVARSGVTESASLTYAVEQLTRIGVHLVGVVLNDIDFKRDAVYDPTYRALNEYAAVPGDSR